MCSGFQSKRLLELIYLCFKMLPWFFFCLKKSKGDNYSRSFSLKFMELFVFVVSLLTFHRASST